jgi:hypothetical protein
MKNLFIVLIFSFSAGLIAQSSLGNIKLRPEYYQTDLSKKDLEKLKTSKTFFVLPTQFSERYNKEEYQSILDKAWTINEIEIIQKEDIKKYVKIGNSFIKFKSISVNTGKSSYAFNYLKLGVVNKIKKKKDGGVSWFEDFYGVVFFTTNVDARMDMVKMKDTVYGDLLDYRLGYIKNYVQQLNTGIRDSKSYNIYDDYVNEKHIKNLKEKKLFIPQNMIYGFNAFTGKAREKSSTELFEDYTYDYEVIDENELSDNILNNEEPFYYLI